MSPTVMPPPDTPHCSSSGAANDLAFVARHPVSLYSCLRLSLVRFSCPTPFFFRNGPVFAEFWKVEIISGFVARTKWVVSYCAGERVAASCKSHSSFVVVVDRPPPPQRLLPLVAPTLRKAALFCKCGFCPFRFWLNFECKTLQTKTKKWEADLHVLLQVDNCLVFLLCINFSICLFCCSSGCFRICYWQRKCSFPF